MALDDIVRNGVALVNTITASLQAGVAYHAWISADKYGTPTFASPVTIQMVVEQKQRLRTTASGQTIMTRAKLTVLTPITPNGASGRTEPIDTRDKFVLPDGTTGPIVDVEGLVDPATGRPFLGEIWLGVGGVRS